MAISACHDPRIVEGEATSFDEGWRFEETLMLAHENTKCIVAHGPSAYMKKKMVSIGFFGVID